MKEASVLEELRAHRTAFLLNKCNTVDNVGKKVKDMVSFKSSVIRIVSNYGRGDDRNITVDMPTTLRQVLEPSEVAHETNYLIKVRSTEKTSSTEVDLNYVLQPHDIVLITPRHIRAAAPVPTMRRFKKFLRANGYIQSPGTATDHEKWQSPHGKSLEVNAANGNKSEVDLASFKACATLEGINIHTLYKRL